MIFYRKDCIDSSSEYFSYLQLNPPLVRDFDSTKINIICPGGSTSEFKNDNNRDCPGLLENELRKEVRYQDVKIYNQGKKWYSSQHILKNHISNLRQYKPEVIIFMENINDLLHNADLSWPSNGEFREDYGNFLGPLTRFVSFENIY